MSETKNIFLPNKEIFEYLKKYIEDNASVSTWVGRNAVDNKNPMIVFEETRNELRKQSTTYDHTTRVMSYNINIYCSKLNNSYEIINELSTLVIEVMQSEYHLSGGLIAILPTFDDKNKISYKATLRFVANFQTNYNKIF